MYANDSADSLSECVSSFLLSLPTTKLIWRKATSLFYHTRQVAAHVALFRLMCAFMTPVLGERRSWRVNDGTIRKSDGSFL